MIPAFHIHAVTDRGPRPSPNQDALVVQHAFHHADRMAEPARLLLDAPPLFAAVADGVGGHPAGERAARFVCGHLAACAERARHVPGQPDPARTEDLPTLLRAVNEALIRHGLERDSAGMASTVVTLAARGPHLAWSNLGDSRLYRFAGARLAQLTTDHTGAHPNSITQCVGGYRYTPIAPSLGTETARPGARYLLCTDGLTKALDDATIADVLTWHAHDAAAQLLARALERGVDNTSVVVIDVLAPAAARWHLESVPDPYTFTCVLTPIAVRAAPPGIPGAGAQYRLLDAAGRPYLGRCAGDEPLRLHRPYRVEAHFHLPCNRGLQITVLEARPAPHPP